MVCNHNKSKFSLPSLRMLYLPGAASSEGADWTGVGGGVSSAGLGWLKVKGNSSVTSLLDKKIVTISTLLFNKINKQQFSLSTLERGRQNVENLSETMSRRRMLLLQSSEHFDLIFMVFSWRRFLQNRAVDKEKNTLRHHCVISLVCTLTDHSSQPINVGEIA